MVITNTIEWSQGHGPWEMPISCEALSGCYVSNHLNDPSLHVALDRQQQGCKRIKPNETMIVQMIYTPYPQ